MCGGGGETQTQQTGSSSVTRPPRYLRSLLNVGKWNPETGMYQAPQNAKGQPKAPLGINKSAMNYYNTYRNLSPEQQSAISGQLEQLETQKDQYGNFFDVANNFLSGNYNANPVSAGSVNLSDELAKLGVNDPTAAMESILSGQINNPYLEQMLQGFIDQSMQGYNDALQNVSQSILPSLRTNSVISGTYGGSRQGVAEGLVGQQLERNARDLAESAMGYGSNLYGTAYEAAQARQAALAGQLASQAQALGTSNADRALAEQIQNAAIQKQNANNALLGLTTQEQGMQGQNQVYNAIMGLLQSPQSQEISTLQQAAGLILPQAAPAGQTITSGYSTVGSGGGGDTLGSILQIVGLVASLAGAGGGGGGA